MLRVDDVLNSIPSWGKYRIESYYHGGVTYPPTSENREKLVKMILAEDDTTVIYV